MAASDQMRRSKAAKQVFAGAEPFAPLGDCVVYPGHFLYAVLLAEDEKRDQILSEFGGDLKRLQHIAKVEALFPRTQGASHADKGKRQLN